MVAGITAGKDVETLLYIDCQAGIAGDMTVAALIDLGLPIEYLREELARLQLPSSSYTITSELVKRQGIAARSFTVQEGAHQPHRNYQDIVAIIELSRLADAVKARVSKVFARLAEAEAKVHGVETNQVHFHEVGGIDSIVDIVGTAIGLEYFSVNGIYASAVPLGSGFVETAHGRLPVPAPATAELLRGVPVHGDIGPGERVTPTGAAILAALGKGFGKVPAMTIKAVGYGAGRHDFKELPNVVRLVLGENTVTGHTEQVFVLETQIDDMSPEIFGYLMERLLDQGALDVTFSPLQMKKNRPGTLLSILATPEKLDLLVSLILQESTAIGVRYYPVERYILPRLTVMRDTSLGPVQVKVVEKPSGEKRFIPEFEECRRVALERDIPLLEVFRTIEYEVRS
jgi:uncharacterized protein (TIGR00299 family) protein